ncbi:MAG: VPLPA-CTERM sorting domain-containing protein, partial [Pseudomonadota bacterium]
SIRATVTAAFLGVASQVSATPVNITIDYATPVNAEIESAMDTAVAIWEYLLPSYRSAPSDLSVFSIPAPLVVETIFENIDGPGRILGSAGPRFIASSQDNREIYSHTAQMRFDTSDLPGGTFVQGVTLFMHELSHTLGYGTLWDASLNNGVNYDLTDGDGTPATTPTRYTGANALAAYRAEVDPTATFIPLEDGGGTGTAGGHWDEGAIGASFVPGDFFGPELMSGIFFSGPSAFVSETTLASFEDIGFNTREGYSAMTIDELIAAVSVPAVPLPAGGWLLLAGIGGLVVMRRKSQKPD